MTISEVLGKSTKELQALTDIELEEYLRPSFQYTRPVGKLPEKEKAKKAPKEKVEKEKKLSPKDQLKAELAELLKSSGVKLPQSINL